PKLQECRADPTSSAVNQHALTRSDLSGTMQHLVCSDVVQYEADALGSVQPTWHRNQFTLRQADKLRIRTADRHGSDYLTGHDSSHILSYPIRRANQVPTRREGHRGRFGVNTLTRHHIGQRYTCRQHSHPHLTTLRFGTLLFKKLERIRSAVVGNDDSPV